MASLPEDKLAQLEKRFDSVEAALSAGPSADEFVRLSKEYAELEPVVRPITQWRKANDELRSAEELAESGDKDMAEMAEAEIAELRPRIAQMESEDGWVPLGAVGTQLANLASDFDPRTFGFRKLSDLVRKTNAFDIEHPEGGSMRIRTRSPADNRLSTKKSSGRGPSAESMGG